MRSLRALLTERWRGGPDRSDWLRLSLLVAGLTSGFTVIVALVLLGGAVRPLFEQLQGAADEPPGVVVEPPRGGFGDTDLDVLQQRIRHARLCPEIEVSASIDSFDGIPIRLLALDFLGDPRIPVPAPALTAEALIPLVRPTVLLSSRLLEIGSVAPGDVVTLRVGERSGLFAVGKRALPDEFLSRSVGSVVALDIAHFRDVFGGDRVDRVVVMPESGRVREGLEAELRAHVPAEARIVQRGTESGLASGWIATWRAVAFLVLNAGFLAGMVVIMLSVLASFSRQRERYRPVRARGYTRGVVFVAQAAEVVACALLSAGFSLLYGNMLAGAIVGWLIPITPTDAVAPLRLPPLPDIPFLVAVGMGVGLPSAWVFLVGGDDTGNASPVEIPREPAALAGFLLVLASALLSPFGGRYGLVAGYAAIFLIMMAIGLLGRPVLAAVFRASRWLPGRGRSVVGRAIAGQMIEPRTQLGVTLALLVFTFAAVAASWTAISELRGRHTEWVGRVFGPDLIIEMPRSEGAVARTRIPAEICRRIESLPEVRDAAGMRHVAATMAGATLPVMAVPGATIAGLRVSTAPGLNTGAGAAGGAAEHVWMARSIAADLGLVQGQAVRMETATGSWPIVIAGIYDPALGEMPRAYVHLDRALGRLTRDHDLSALQVHFDPGVLPSRGHEAVAEAAGVPLCYRVTGSPRVHLDRGAWLAWRAVLALVLTLAVLAVVAVASVGPGLVHDCPRGWRVLDVLGVPRRRIVLSAGLVLAVVTAAALGVGGVLGVGSGAALMAAASGPEIGRIDGVGARGMVALVGVTLWLLAITVGAAALRRGLFRWDGTYGESG